MMRLYSEFVMKKVRSMFINSNDSNRPWPIVDLSLNFITLSFENTRSHVTRVDGIVRKNLYYATYSSVHILLYRLYLCSILLAQAKQLIHS